MELDSVAKCFEAARFENTEKYVIRLILQGAPPLQKSQIAPPAISTTEIRSQNIPWNFKKKNRLCF